MKRLLLSTAKINRVYYRFFFKRCFFCNVHSEDIICQYCLNGIAENETYCSLCKQPSTIPMERCGACLKTPPQYHQLIAPYLYQGFIKALIKQLKFSQAKRNSYVLCSLLANQLNQHYEDTSWPTILLYVPSHHKRIKERGFCHMRVLATTLVEVLDGNIQLNHTALIKSKNSKPQHQNSKKQRHALHKNTFQVQEKIPKHIALLDDVMTTGSTINACVSALQKSGAERIDVWCFARTALTDDEE